MRWILFFLVFSLQLHAQNSLPALGMWREHAPYQGSIDVTASEEKIYAATEYNLFSVDRQTKEIQRYSKVSGLSETGITAIQFDPLSQKLYVAYTNSNIDVLDSKGIRNIPGLKRANIAGDKKIYHIYPANQRSYFSTGLGVVVVDAERLEIRETWQIGSAGNAVKTNGFTQHNGFFYAATDEGLKRISTSGSNPANYAAWQNLSGANGLSRSPAKYAGSLQNRLIVLQNDSLFSFNGTNWSLFFANDFSILSVNASNDKWIIGQRKANGAAQVVVLNGDGTPNRILQRPSVIEYPYKGISVGNEFWIADLFGGLSAWTGGSPEVYKPNSPWSVALGQMLVRNGILYATAGTVNDSWNYQYNRTGLMRFNNGYWDVINGAIYPSLDSLLDIITVAVDPRDGSAWAGSYGGGLLQVKENNTFSIFKQNSTLEAAVGDPGSYRVSGLAFDSEGNLWVSNFGANRQLHVRKNDGSWKAFTAPFLLNFNAVSQILVDDAGQKWVVSPLGNGLMVFNDNNSIDNTSDDKWRLYRAGAGMGNLPSNFVQCMAKDKSGFIWVGTSDGVAVIQCPQDAFNNGCDAVLPIIKEGAFASYLFKGKVVNSIAVDGADRKWIASNDGVWLVSRDGDKVLQHFTETNSPLPGNDVRSIAIDGATGEVYFGSTKGIVSYRGGATEATESKNEVLVFPNPVPPGYSGSIGIRGLPDNSIVKIIEPTGRLVFQTRSLGGQAVWDGKDYKGGRASSGVYLVMAVNDDKTEKVVGKVVFIGQ